MIRRDIIRGALAAGVCGGFAPALWAQPGTAANYPDRAIRIVVPYPPGGFNDVFARLVGKHLTETWKQAVVVDNKPGGNTVIGNVVVATAPADGYTLLVTPLPFAVLPALYGSKLPYDAIKSFQPVIWGAYSQNVLVARKGLPAKTVAELVQYARKNPGKLNYASSGSGSSTHLSAELFKNMTRTDITHVPYKGSAPAVQAILSGEADLLFDNLPNVVAHLKAGTMVALGVTGRQRASQLPDVPTVDEAGVPGYEVLAWFGLQAPAGTPEPVVAKLNAEVVRMLNSADIVKQLAAQGVEVEASSVARFSELIKSEVAKWGKLAAEANIKVE